MILIADSGATKADWRLVKADGSIQQAQTAGISPFYQTATQIAEALRNQLLPHLPQETVQQVFFYGTGCSTEANVAIVKQGFLVVFPQATIVVEHDTLAAARALCGHNPGIACILGTGSNACLYDGTHIAQSTMNLGFFLGDEGSGAVMGRQLVVAFLHQEMPQHLSDKFARRFPEVNRETVLENTHRNPFPSRYFAQFSKFIFDHLADPFCYQLAYDGFQIFLKRYVKTLPGAQTHPVHFVGSVAFYYSNVLLQACQDLGLRAGNVMESPIAGLTLYHIG